MADLRLNNPTMDMAVRATLKIADTVNRHLDAIDVREDLLIAEAVRTGKCVINYAPDDKGNSEQAILDFGRDAANDVTLAKGNQFSDDAFDWIGFFDSVINHMANQDGSGAPTLCLMGSTAKTWFLKATRSGALKSFLDVNFTGASDIALMRGMIEPATQKDPISPLGVMGDLNFFWFNGSYKDPDTNVSLPTIGSNEVLFINDSLGAAIYNFPVLDFDANFQPLQKFSKTWIENSPSARIVETQAAILPFLLNPNASYRAIVCEA